MRYASPKTVDGSSLELTKIRQQTNLTRQQTLESTRRIVDLFQECEDAGVHTLKNLTNQRAKLNQSEENLDKIRESLMRSEKTVIRMTNTEACPCAISCCILPCNRKHKEKNSTLWKGKKNKKRGKSSTVRESNELALKQKSGMKKQGHVTFATEVESKTPVILTAKESEKEIDKNLDRASEIVRTLKNTAIEMDAELTSGNAQLDRLNQKTEGTNLRVSSINTKSNRLLNMSSSWCPNFTSCCNPFKVTTALVKS